jgi:DUF2075 family protein
MLLTIEDFIRRTQHDLKGLTRSLQDATARFGEEEVRAWERSLPVLATALNSKPLAGLHVAVRSKEQSGLDVEYRLPASNAWADVVLLGRDSAKRPAAVIVELKHWETAGDTAGPTRTMVTRPSQGMVLHPCEQARGYAEYCRRFHSAVQSRSAAVSACALFTRATDLGAYRAAPHEDLVREYPVFSAEAGELRERFPDFVARHLHGPDEEWADEFDRGVYKQDRVFVRAVADAILDPANRDFVLLDSQHLGFEKSLHAIQRAVDRKEKAVVVIQGPPGSGKSVLAAKLWAALARESKRKGDIVLVTTSASQKSNWKEIFDVIAKTPAGRGLVKGANEFNPGLSPKWVKDKRAAGNNVKIADWRKNIELAAREGKKPRLHPEIAIVDEAHALIDPTAKGKEGIAPGGWTHHAGPQGWHIIKQSKVSVFLMDSEQSYRDNETTSIESIRDWARDNRAATTVEVSLADSQFRSAGSKQYVDWVTHFLAGSAIPDDAKPDRWLRSPAQAGMTFEIADSPLDMERGLNRHVEAGMTARLLASYGRKWSTKKAADPHKVRSEDMDFAIRCKDGRQDVLWSKPWNVVPGGSNYAAFIQALPHTRMGADTLSEVGCPYVVRGFDWDYIGLLWLSDLVWRTDRWVPNPKQSFESAWNKTLAAAKKDAKRKVQGAGLDELRTRLARGYRILLTRAIRGVYVWCEDDETRTHLRQALGR